MLSLPKHLEHAERARAYNDLAQDAMKRRDWATAALYTKRAQQCASESMSAQQRDQGRA